MATFREWIARLSGTLHFGRPDRDLESELRVHLELAAEDERRAGRPPESARRAAVIRSGGLSQAMEALRDQRGVPVMSGMMQDARYAVRQLRANVSFSAVVVLTLAAGLGASTAVYSCLHSLLSAAAPPVDLSTRVALWSAQPTGSNSKVLVSLQDYLEWKARATSLDLLAAARNSAFNLGAVDRPARVSAQEVTATSFEMLGIRVALGRAFTQKDEQPGAPRTAILSAGFWRDHFDQSPAVLGRTVLLDGRPTTVVGVLRPSAFPTDVFVPLVFTDDPGARRARTLFVMGRLRPGVTIEHTRAEMTAIGRTLASEYADSDQGWTVSTRPLAEEFLGPNARIAYTVLAAAAALLLLIGCANVASLLLARGLTRQRELAVRVALGASRLRVGRQLLVEALLLAGVSAAVGTLGAHAGLAWIRAVFPLPPAVLDTMHIDASTLLFAAVAGGCAAVLVGVLPAIQSGQIDVTTGLQDASPRTVGGRRVRRLHAILLAGQMVLASVLVVVAGLLGRTLIHLDAIADQGFDPHGVLTANLTLPEAEYAPTSVAPFFERLLGRIAADPTVAVASAVSRVPAAGSRYNPNRSLTIEGRPVSQRDAVWALDLTAAPGYFEALRIPRLDGRDFSTQDDAGQPLVVVVNATMAKRYWPGHSAIGARLRLGDEPTPDAWHTVVGVVGDVRNDRIVDAPLPQVFVPLAQRPARTMTLVVRGRGDRTPGSDLIRSAVASLDRDQPVYDVQTMEQVLEDDLAGSRSLIQLIGVFATLSVLLAASGVYALVSFAVATKAPEMGIRMALGALPRHVLVLIVRQTFQPVVIGLVLGLLAPFATSHLMQSVLYGVTPADPVTYGICAAVFGAVTLIATLGPALRAASLDPMTVLRAS